MSYRALFRVWRGDADGGELADYTVEVNDGEVVLDVIHRLQATQCGDLAVRWNCKAGKCGSCSAEVNGMPKLMCMTRMSTFAEDETVTVTPMRTFPVIKDLVTDVSYNYLKQQEIPAFAPPANLAPGEYRMAQADVERSQEFRTCIECFLCQDVCHVVRDHEDNKSAYAGPRLFIRAAELAMHPLDARTDRAEFVRAEQGIGLCNVTKCCTEVCPAGIKITDNAIIPMKERVADRRYDPLVWLGNKISRRKKVVQKAQSELGPTSRWWLAKVREPLGQGRGRLMRREHVVVVIGTRLEAELVAQIAAVDDRLQIRYEPDLLPPSRFACDHRGVESFRRTPEQEKRWRALVSDAEVLFGMPGDSGKGLADAVRTSDRLRWVQATAGGAGEQVRDAGLSGEEQDRVLITRAGGVHAGPLAEFAILGLLAFTKGVPRLLADKQEPRWEHYPMAELAGATVLVVGLGSVGAEVARLAKAFGMRVIAVNRTGRTDCPDVDEVRTSRFLGDLLPVAHGVVLTLPLTDETRGMIDATAIGRMHSGAVLVDIGRGGVLDESALVHALDQDQLAGAALDVFATEPLPADSPLWDLPNVLLSPHTAGLSQHENERIVALFSENLRRYLAGDELLSRVHPTLLY